MKLGWVGLPIAGIGDAHKSYWSSPQNRRRHRKRKPPVDRRLPAKHQSGSSLFAPGLPIVTGKRKKSQGSKCPAKTSEEKTGTPNPKLNQYKLTYHHEKPHAYHDTHPERHGRCGRQNLQSGGVSTVLLDGLNESGEE